MIRVRTIRSALTRAPALLAAAFFGFSAAAEPFDHPVFKYEKPGELIEGTAQNGGSVGDVSDVILLPNMLFPIETGPAFVNSQVNNPGGKGHADSHGGVYGAENDPANYDYPWRDLFCEKRSGRKNVRCPATSRGNKIGHQGVDIRPAACENGKYKAVAPEDVEVVYVGAYSVFLYSTQSNTTYVYLHLKKPLVSVEDATGDVRPLAAGDMVKRGGSIGYVSDRSSPDLITPGDGKCPNRNCTTLHLHFEIWQGKIEAPNSGGRKSGVAALSPYMSLVKAYHSRLAQHLNEAQPVRPVKNACSAVHEP